MIPAELFLAVVLYALGLIVFGHFESGTPTLRRVRKYIVLVGLIALVCLTVGRPWSWVFVVGLFGVSIAVHCWWCIRHGIHPITAEPRDRYRQLRGWA